jgi:hypothetical protein
VQLVVVEVVQETNQALQVVQVEVVAVFGQMQVMVKVEVVALPLQGRDLEVEMGLELARKQPPLVAVVQVLKV